MSALPPEPDQLGESPWALDCKLNEARRELLETSTRSRLLHTPLGSSRAKIIEAHDELAEEVFRILVRDGKSMYFRPSAEEVDGDRIVALSLPQPEEEKLDGLPARHADRKLQTGLRQIVENHLGVEPQAAIVEVARMLGFQRTGHELQRIIEEQLRAMLGEGVLSLRNGNRLYISDETIT